MVGVGNNSHCRIGCNRLIVRVCKTVCKFDCKRIQRALVAYNASVSGD